jgi:glycosyltransferase involved in cell wall biosynthesis
MDVKDPDTPSSVYNRLLSNSDAVFTISHYLEEEVEQVGGKRVVYLPVFVDADIFQTDTTERAKIRKSLGMADKEIVIGYAGSFSRIEGVPFLLKAFKSISRRYVNARLVVVGGRNVADSDDIVGLTSELGLNNRVILVPHQPHALMPKYLSAFDIACSPKIDCEENRAANPIKIYEYMSMGLPMVVSAVGEIAKVVENGVDGFLVKAGDEKDLEKTLEYVIQNPDSAPEVGKRAREKVMKNYTQLVLRKRIEDTLDSLVKRKPEIR